MNELTIGIATLVLNVLVAASSIFWLAYKAGVMQATNDARDKAIELAQAEMRKQIEKIAVIPILESKVATIESKKLSEFPTALARIDGRISSLEDWRGSIRGMPAVRKPSRPDPGEL